MVERVNDLGGCRIIRATLNGNCTLTDCRKHEVLIEKFGYSPELSTEAVGVLRTEMTIANAQKLERPICRDPDDDNIIATAVAGNCDCIITGDEDLLVLKAYEGIDILSPRDFLIKES